MRIESPELLENWPLAEMVLPALQSVPSGREMAAHLRDLWGRARFPMEIDVTVAEALDVVVLGRMPGTKPVLLPFLVEVDRVKVRQVSLAGGGIDYAPLTKDLFCCEAVVGDELCFAITTGPVERRKDLLERHFGAAARWSPGEQKLWDQVAGESVAGVVSVDGLLSSAPAQMTQPIRQMMGLFVGPDFTGAAMSMRREEGDRATEMRHVMEVRLDLSTKSGVVGQLFDRSDAPVLTKWIPEDTGLFGWFGLELGALERLLEMPLIAGQLPNDPLTMAIKNFVTDHWLGELLVVRPKLSAARLLRGEGTANTLVVLAIEGADELVDRLADSPSFERDGGVAFAEGSTRFTLPPMPGVPFRHCVVTPGFFVLCGDGDAGQDLLRAIVQTEGKGALPAAARQRLGERLPASTNAVALSSSLDDLVSKLEDREAEGKVSSGERAGVQDMAGHMEQAGGGLYAVWFGVDERGAVSRYVW